MRPPALTCDHNRLEAFLEGDLIDAEENELAAHLNECVRCRQQLEASAAEPDCWNKVAQFLKPQAIEDVGSHVQLPQWSLQVQHVLNALAPTDDPNMLGRLAGYEVSGVVGAGAMGVVLKAFDKSLDRTVAIKVMAPHLASSGAARKRFAREAKAAAAVLHPNVMAIHSVSSGDSPPHLVMPYLRGTSLQKRLDNEGPLPVGDILRVGSQIAAGLAAAHAQGLVHRDIKPANILLEEGVERVAITDFGLARAVDDATMTRTGVIAGTPQYMSPEQARGDLVDHRSDLFSLGSVMYTMCTGRPPFRAETSYGILRRITDTEPRPIREINPDIPEWLCAIIEKLMSKQTDARFVSAAEVSELLEDCLAHVQRPDSTELPRQIAEFNAQPSVRSIRIGLVAKLTTVAVITTGVVLFAILFFSRGAAPGDSSSSQAVHRNTGSDAEDRSPSEARGESTDDIRAKTDASDSSDSSEIDAPVSPATTEAIPWRQRVAMMPFEFEADQATRTYSISQCTKSVHVALGRPAPARSDRPVKIEFCLEGQSRPAVALDGHEHTVFRVAGGAVFVAVYSVGSTGCTVEAHDLKTGKQRWSTRLNALGERQHSTYANRVNMRMLDGAIVVFGRESFGDYIEVLEAGTGRRLAHREIVELAAGKLAKVSVAPALYERKDDKQFFIRVTVHNLADREIAVDLRNPRFVISLRRWSARDTSERWIIDERRRRPVDFTAEDGERLKTDFGRKRNLVHIPRGESADYYWPFNGSDDDSTRTAVDSAGRKFVILSMAGELRLTDGRECEVLRCGRPGEADVVIPRPVPWGVAPARVITP